VPRAVEAYISSKKDFNLEAIRVRTSRIHIDDDRRDAAGVAHLRAK